MKPTQETEAKLFLLYLAKRLPGRTPNDLMEIALKSCYLNYFDYQTLFERLLGQGLLYMAEMKNEARRDAEGRQEKRVYLGEQGELIVAELSKDLPLPMRAVADRLSLEHQDVLGRRDSVFAEYEAAGDGRYRLSLSLKAGAEKVLAMDLSLPTEALCQRIAAQWKRGYAELYMQLLRLLAEGAPEEARAAGGSGDSRSPAPAAPPSSAGAADARADEVATKGE